MVTRSGKSRRWVVCGGFLRPDEPRMDGAVCPTPDRGPAHSAPDPEMAKGGGERRRRVVGDEGRDAARGRDFASAGEHLSALRIRPVGGGMAEEGGERRCDRGSLRRRSCGGVRAPGRSRAVSEGVWG